MNTSKNTIFTMNYWTTKSGWLSRTDRSRTECSIVTRSYHTKTCFRRSLVNTTRNICWLSRRLFGIIVTIDGLFVCVPKEVDAPHYVSNACTAIMKIVQLVFGFSTECLTTLTNFRIKRSFINNVSLEPTKHANRRSHATLYLAQHFEYHSNSTIV